MSTIRRQIGIDASPRIIWQALTSVDGVKRWLADEARIDARQGGRVVLKLHGKNEEEIGFLHVFRPTGRLEIMWDKQASGEWRGTRTLFQVARDGKESVVHIQHAGPQFENEAERTRMDGFWKDLLVRLREELEK